jgi:hypothetical protein
MKAANDSIASLREALRESIGALRAEMHGLETRIIKWLTGTVIGVSALAFSIAKFIG